MPVGGYSFHVCPTILCGNGTMPMDGEAVCQYLMIGAYGFPPILMYGFGSAGETFEINCVVGRALLPFKDRSTSCGIKF